MFAAAFHTRTVTGLVVRGIRPVHQYLQGLKMRVALHELFLLLQQGYQFQHLLSILADQLELVQPRRRFFQQSRILVAGGQQYVGGADNLSTLLCHLPVGCLVDRSFFAVSIRQCRKERSDGCRFIPAEIQSRRTRIGVMCGECLQISGMRGHHCTERMLP